MIGTLIAIAVKVALWTGAVMAVASVGYTAYDVSQSVVEATEGARRSSRAARDAADEFARSGSGAGLDELQKDYTEGQLAQHRAIGRVSSTLTEDLLTSVGPFSGDSKNTFSTNTLTTLSRIPDTLRGLGGTATASGTATAASGTGTLGTTPTRVATPTATRAASPTVTRTASPRATVTAPPDSGGGTYVGTTAGYEDLLREGRITENSVRIEVAGNTVTFSARLVIVNEGISYDGATILCSVSVEAVVSPTSMPVSATGFFGGTVRWDYRFYGWTGPDCDDDSRDQDPFDDLELDGRVLDNGVEGALSIGGTTLFTFTAEER